MTRALFLEDAYLQEAQARVTGIDEEGAVIADASLFYATGGGQPGDTGRITWDGGAADVTNTLKGEGGAIRLILEDGAPRPPEGAQITQHLDWERRLAHMKIHTALHLLSVVIPLPVNGGAITAVKGRLDFDMPEPVDRDHVEAELNRLIAADLPVWESAITDAELDANPQLVKTMSVQPPRGAGTVRLIGIGQGAHQVDLQPCGGTHVASTGQIGPVRIGKIEKKGRQNRRVNLLLGETA